MKKKKIKKKIKFFENRLNSLHCRLNKLEKKFEETDSHLGEDWQAAIQVVNDSSCDLKKAKKTYEIAERSIKNTLDEFNKRIMILESITQVDYTKFSEKTCDTCKWEPLMQQGGQDIPCMGCTANDKKMWKSKGEDNL